MKLLQSFLLFVPICFVICVVTSSLHRESMKEAVRHAVRSTLRLSGTVVLLCAVIYFVLEWILN